MTYRTPELQLVGAAQGIVLATGPLIVTFEDNSPEDSRENPPF